MRSRFSANPNEESLLSKKLRVSGRALRELTDLGEELRCRVTLPSFSATAVGVWQSHSMLRFTVLPTPTCSVASARFSGASYPGEPILTMCPTEPEGTRHIVKNGTPAGAGFSGSSFRRWSVAVTEPVPATAAGSVTASGFRARLGLRTCSLTLPSDADC